MEERLSSLKHDYENITVPKEALERVQKGIQKAKSEEKTVPFSGYKKLAAGAAAAFVILAISVNSSPQVAYAMGSVPLIGKVFRVITIRNYNEETQDTYISANIPKIDEKAGEAAAAVNKASSDYVDDLLEKFKEYCTSSGIEYGSLEVNYTVAADTKDYFSLDIVAVETYAGAYEFHKFYTIDKASDKVIKLSDLFDNGADYVTPVSDEILRQMKESGKDYFIASDEFDNEGFSQISQEQEFYVDSDGNLVICFDEYEVGPGSIGAPRFTIPRELLHS